MVAWDTGRRLGVPQILVEGLAADPILAGKRCLGLPSERSLAQILRLRH